MENEQGRPDSTVPRMRSVVSYVQRGGRMTVGQERAWTELWPTMGRAVAELGDIDDAPTHFDTWFGRSAPLLLEVGSGMGETTSQLAAAAPEVNYLAVEVYQAGLGQLMLRADKLGVKNLRLLHGDAVILLTRHIPPGALSGVRVFFPDPWPKKRHHKRRLVQQDFVALITSRLAPGATLHLATDWEHYAEQMLEVCSAEPGLRNTSTASPGWASRPDWRPVTKFEQRAREEGRVSRDLIFEKRPSSEDRREFVDEFR